MLTSEQTSSSEDPLATALEKYAIASEKVGEARLEFRPWSVTCVEHAQAS